MEIGIRGLIALAGALIFAYVAWDAYRSRRRNQYKFKLEKNIPADEPRAPGRAAQDRDHQGFDLLGISQPRVRSLDDSGDEREGEAALDHAQAKPVNAAPAVTAADMFNDDEQIPTLKHIEPRFGEPPVPNTVALSPVPASTSEDSFTAEPMASSAPAQSAHRELNKNKQAPALSTAHLGRTADLFADAPVPEKSVRESSRKALKPARASTVKPLPDGGNVEVIALTVLGKNGRYFRGSDLALAFMELDLRFGEHELFHRHADVAGTGEILFSIANALKPGSFEPARMEAINTPGLSLFMTVPGPSAPRLAYDDLLATAEHLAQRLGGEVKDASRKFSVADVRRGHEDIIFAYEQRQQMLEV